MPHAYCISSDVGKFHAVEFDFDQLTSSYDNGKFNENEKSPKKSKSSRPSSAFDEGRYENPRWDFAYKPGGDHPSLNSRTTLRGGGLDEYITIRPPNRFK